jgi:hypothetical protein
MKLYLSALLFGGCAFALGETFTGIKPFVRPATRSSVLYTMETLSFALVANLPYHRNMIYRPSITSVVAASCVIFPLFPIPTVPQTTLILHLSPSQTSTRSSMKYAPATLAHTSGENSLTTKEASISG